MEPECSLPCSQGTTFIISQFNESEIWGSHCWFLGCNITKCGWNVLMLQKKLLHIPLKQWYISFWLHGITLQKTTFFTVNQSPILFNIHYNINQAIWSGLFLLKLSANIIYISIFPMFALSLWSILVTFYFHFCLLNSCCTRSFPTKFNVHSLSS